MTPGLWLHRIARAVCSTESCRQVLEPAIADVQHDYARSADSVRRGQALLRGYAAFWQSLAWCLAHDAFGGNAREFNSRAAIAFLVALTTVGVVEMLVMHTSEAIRRLVVCTHPIWPYVGFSAMSDTATLRFGVPLAIFPALFYATRRSTHFTPSAALRTIAFGLLITIVASGWIAPGVERWRSLRERDAFAAATHGRIYMDPIEWSWDRSPQSKTWPDLIRGAFAPPSHRYPGYPNYVAPEDRDLTRYRRLEIYVRLFMAALAIGAGLLGWATGRIGRTHHGELRGGDHSQALARD
jgi:hypothetical protein